MQSSNLSCFLLNYPSPRGIRASASAITTRNLRVLLQNGVRDLLSIFYYRFCQRDDVALQLKIWVDELRKQLERIGGMAALGKFIDKTDLALRVEGLMPLQAYWSAFVSVLQSCARSRVTKFNNMTTADKEEALKNGREHSTPAAYVEGWTKQALLRLNNRKYCTYWSLLQEALRGGPLGEKAAEFDWMEVPRARPFFLPISTCSVTGRWGGFIAWVEQHALPQYAEWVICLLAELRNRSALQRKSRGTSFAIVEESAQWLRGMFAHNVCAHKGGIEPYCPPLFGLPFQSIGSIPAELLERVCSGIEKELTEEWRFLIFSARYGYARSTLDVKANVDSDWGCDDPPRWLLAARAHMKKADEIAEKKCTEASSSTSVPTPIAHVKQELLTLKKRKRVLPEWMISSKSRPGSSRARANE